MNHSFRGLADTVALSAVDARINVIALIRFSPIVEVRDYMTPCARSVRKRNVEYPQALNVAVGMLSTSTNSRNQSRVESCITRNKGVGT